MIHIYTKCVLSLTPLKTFKTQDFITRSQDSRHQDIKITLPHKALLLDDEYIQGLV